jgi:hypothetical protein
MGSGRSGDRGGMTKLLQMSLKVATAVARTSAQLVEMAIERVRGGGHHEEAHWTAASPPPSMPVTPREPWIDDGSPAAAPPPPPPEPPPVVEVPEAPPVPEPPEPPPIVAVPEPTPGEAARVREQRREAETTADSPGAEIHVEEPWQGYASMNAPEIIDRLAVSDAAVKAVVLLYEQRHKARKTVLRAASR